ncbi:2'-5' RNA ligase family protein [Piscinibacter sp.]|uniref:2'-5' RNA ligase family protein n=1 Tax=Piscinibacter sp. TaxID=1903157 RepID=UPI0039E6CE09
MSGRPGQGLTLASEPRDFPDWHLGRPRFALWAIALDDADVDTRLARVREALGGLLLAGYRRQPHLTVQVCGFPVAAPARHDDFGAGRLEAQLDALARSRAAPFELRIGDAFSFTSAACLSVQGDALPPLRASLQRAAPSSDATPYVAHVTAGLYAGAWPLREVHERLASIPPAPALRVRVRALDWMCYDSADIAGPLQTLLRFDLDGGGVRVADAALLRAVFGARGPAR